MRKISAQALSRTKQNGFWLVALLAVAVLALTGWLAAADTAQAVDTASVSVSSTSVQPGGLTAVGLTVTPGSGKTVGAVIVDVSYDTTALTATSCTPGPTCNTGFGPGVVRIVRVDPAGLSGTVGTISFLAGDTTGKAVLGVTIVECVDETGAPLSCSASDGSLNITTVIVEKPIGDVNCDWESTDGLPNIVDAQLIAQVVVGRISEGDLDCPDNADVNENGEVDIADAQLIAQLVVGRIGWPPA